jgi:hypothetical protein
MFFIHIRKCSKNTIGEHTLANAVKKMILFSPATSPIRWWRKLQDAEILVKKRAPKRKIADNSQQ